MNITRPQLDAMLAAAQEADPDEVERIYEIVLRDNGEKIYKLSVRWKDVGGRPPVNYAGDWPPQTIHTIKQGHPVSRMDVDDLIATRGTNPADVQVTRDPNAVVGWTFIEGYIF